MTIAHLQRILEAVKADCEVMISADDNYSPVSISLQIIDDKTVLLLSPSKETK